MRGKLVRGAELDAEARFFRILGDPTRLQIIRLLDGGEKSVGELVRAVGQPQPRVSTHLACLRFCRLVATERRGKEVYYRLTIRGFGELVDGTADLIEPLSEWLAQCQRIGPDWV